MTIARAAANIALSTGLLFAGVTALSPAQALAAHSGSASSEPAQPAANSPQTRHEAHAKPAKKHAQKHGNKHRGGKHSGKHGGKHGGRHGGKSQADSRAIAKIRAVARAIDNSLRAAGTDERLTGLSEPSIAAIRANLTADHDTLVGLVKTVTANPTTAATAWTQLRGYSTSNYSIAVEQARAAERLLTSANQYTDYVASLPAEAQATYAQATTHTNTALLSARAVRATSPRTALPTIWNELREAMRLFGQVRASNHDWHDDDWDDDDDWNGDDWDHGGHGGHGGHDHGGHHGWSNSTPMTCQCAALP